MSRKPVLIAPSVHARLLRRSQELGEDFQLTLQRYAVERLLWRLEQSRYRDQFILKGAMLYAVWGEAVYRPTRDLDLLGERPLFKGECRCLRHFRLRRNSSTFHPARLSGKLFSTGADWARHRVILPSLATLYAASSFSLAARCPPTPSFGRSGHRVAHGGEPEAWRSLRLRHALGSLPSPCEGRAGEGRMGSILPSHSAGNNDLSIPGMILSAFL